MHSLHRAPRTLPFSLRSTALAGWMCAAGMMPLALFANPNPGTATVTGGAVTFNTTTPGTLLVNQTTPRAVINWPGFSIAAGETVRFVQPSAAAVALNRVSGADPISIFGSLSANGQVFLVNPAGVYFAPTAQVNVGALVASSLNITDANFLAGRYAFDAPAAGVTPGSVVNDGTLRASDRGHITLVAPEVVNTGTAQVNGGTVGLVSGNTLLVDYNGDGTVAYTLDTAGVAGSLVTNSGLLDAPGGRVALLAGAAAPALTNVINQTGIVRANQWSQQGGRVTISGGSAGVVALQGTIESKGDIAGRSGGSITVQGQRIGVLGGTMDVSGDAGGGQIVLGGNVPTAAVGVGTERVVVAAGATLNARATGAGTGGSVTVAADQGAVMSGATDVRGVARGGSVSLYGRDALIVRGSVDAGAPGATNGTIDLGSLDNRVAGAATITALTDSGALYGAPVIAPAESAIDATAARSFTGDLTVRAYRDLAVDAGAALQRTGTGTLRLEAGRNLSTAGELSTTGGAALTLNAGRAGDANGASDGTLAIRGVLGSASTGPVALVTGTGAGGISLQGRVDSGAGISVRDRVTLTGDAALSAPTGNVSFTSTIDGGFALSSNRTEGTTSFAAAVGSTTPLASLAVGTQSLGQNLSTSGPMRLGATTLTADVVLRSDGDKDIRSVSATGQALSLQGQGVNRLGPAVGLGALTADNLTATQSIDAQSIVVTGDAALSGSVQAQGALQFSRLTLTDDAVLSSNTAGVSIDAASANGANLTLAGPGRHTLGESTGLGRLVAPTLAIVGDLAAQSVVVQGATELAANVTTTGEQRYGATRLGADTTLNAGTAPVVLGTVTANGQRLSLASTGANTVASASGIGALQATNLTTQGAVSASTVTVSGAATLGGNVVTTGAQAYGSTRLTTDVALDAGTGTTSTGTVSGNNRTLTLRGTGTNTVAGATGLAGLQAPNLTTTGPIAATTVVVAGPATLGGNVTTTGAQRYGNTQLTADVALDAGASTTTLGAVTGGNRTLTLRGTGTNTVAAATGLANLQAPNLTTQGAVSASAVTVTGAATLGGNVSSTAGQNYGSTRLTENVTLNGGSGPVSTGAVSVPSAATGLRLSLSLTGSGVNTVASATGLAALSASNLTTRGTVQAQTVTTTGRATLGGDVVTTGDQRYASTALGADVALNAGLGATSTGAVTGNGRRLTLSGTGNNEVASATGVSALTATNLTTRGAIDAGNITTTGRAVLGGNVTTTGDQRYAAMQLAAPVTLSAANAAVVTGAIEGQGNDLTLQGSGTRTIARAVNLGRLTTQQLATEGAIQATSVQADGLAQLGGDITTSGTQQFAAVRLNNDVRLDSGLSTTAVASVAGQGRALTLAGAANNRVGSVSGVSTLTAHQLTTTGAVEANRVIATGSTRIGGPITTTGDQLYDARSGGLTVANTVLQSNGGTVTLLGSLRAAAPGTGSQLTVVAPQRIQMEVDTQVATAPRQVTLRGGGAGAASFGAAPLRVETLSLEGITQIPSRLQFAGSSLAVVPADIPQAAALLQQITAPQAATVRLGAFEAPLRDFRSFTTQSVAQAYSTPAVDRLHQTDSAATPAHGLERQAIAAGTGTGKRRAAPYTEGKGARLAPCTQRSATAPKGRVRITQCEIRQAATLSDAAQSSTRLAAWEQPDRGR